MFCPACGQQKFAAVAIEGGLPVQRCGACDGVWVELERYRAWRKNMPELAAGDYAGEITFVNDAARPCPLTGRMMARVKVDKDVPLRLDFSPAAQGVWLDAGEWANLVALGLHGQLDAIVSERWQSGLKAAASRERMEAAHRLRFGDAGYKELLRMREWLGGQEKRAEMIAFLNARAD